MKVSLPEQIWIDYETAGFGSRALAFALDFVFRWSFLLLIGLSLLAVGISLEIENSIISSFSQNSFKNFAVTTLTILIFAIELAYPMYFEVRRFGESPGKKILGLKVVDERGLPITARASLLRTLLLMIDFMPAMGLLGFSSMMLSKNQQRVGDLIAKTMVVHKPALLGSNTKESTQDQALLLPLKTYNLLEQFLLRRESFTALARAKAARALLLKLDEREVEDSQIETRLEEIFKASRPAKLSDQPKLISNSSYNWKEFQKKLDVLDDSLAHMSNTSEKTEEEIYSLAEQYQEVCQEYAHVSTFYPETYEARRASQLVRNGRTLIYGRRLSLLRENIEPFNKRVSSSFRVIKHHCAVSFTLGIVGFVLSYLFVTLNSNLSWHFLSEEVVSQLRAGKIWTESIRGMSGVSASGIMVNNIRVTISVFVLGLTGGVGTVLILLYNGVHLGGIFSSLSIYGMSRPLLEFILAHGFLELSIIFVAGGCGLFLGDAILHPGNRSRLRALQNNASQLVDLVAFNAVCLVLAGIVEGYISPYKEFPWSLKLFIGLLLGILYWSFLATGSFIPKDTLRKVVQLLKPAKSL